MTVSGVTILPHRSVTVVHYERHTEPLADYAIGGADMVCNYALSSAAAETSQEIESALPLIIDINPDSAEAIVPGSVLFEWGGDLYYDLNGYIYRNMAAATGAGVQAGTIDYNAGTVEINDYDAGANTVNVLSLLTSFGGQALTTAYFRTPGAPLRPGSLYVQGTTIDGTQVNGTAAFDGTVTGSLLFGSVDVETGIVVLYFGELVTAAGNENEPWYDADNIEDGGQIWKPALVDGSSLTFNCVVYSYIPLDADLLGIDPVRLPTDGRVPIVKSGNIVVVHNTENFAMPQPLSADQVVDIGRANVDLIELYDADGVFVPTTLYTPDLVAGTVTMAPGLDLSGYTEPLTALHRIEDMALVSDVQINGQISLVGQLKHDYPIAGTFVSSALLIGDLAGRVTNLFDQKTWTSEWSDDLIGDDCLANYNSILYPITTTNKGAIKERWALIFDNTDHFNIVGESAGVIGAGYITNTIAPINPATGEPYFTIVLDGWGTGWATGNVVRFNTEAATAPVWITRTTLSGPVTEPDDQFTIQLRGDAD